VGKRVPVFVPMQSLITSRLAAMSSWVFRRHRWQVYQSHAHTTFI